MIVHDKSPTGWLDRVLGAIFALIVVALTLIAIPTVIAIKLNLAHPFLFRLPTNTALNFYTIPFFIWVISVSVISMIYGALSGTMSVLITICNLWSTADNIGQSQRIWFGLIAGGIVTLLMIYFLSNTGLGL